jgi:hypothetical protein
MATDAVVEDHPSWKRSPWFKALGGSRLDVEADELDNGAEHHHTDSDVESTHNGAR